MDLAQDETEFAVLRLMGFLMMAVIGLGGFLTIDYSMASQRLEAEEEKRLSFQDYLGGLSVRLASITASSGSPGALTDMLPRPPEGWTVRPTEADDVKIFLPRNSRDGDPEARKLVTTIGSPKALYKADVVVLTYEKGDQKVVVKAARYPDSIFTGIASMQRRTELQSRSAMFRGLSFMTVRGLDITEDILPDGMRGRLFIADVGGQIHLSVLAPKRMKDAELVAFFQTLDVRAMNASVVDKRDGLGDVPVIVLASALDDAGREAYLADRTRREAEESTRRAEARRAEAAKAAAMSRGDDPAPASDGDAGAQPQTVACDKGVGGIKRCKIGD